MPSSSALAAAWSWIFFACTSQAHLEVVVLWLANVAATVVFFPMLKNAGRLMAPYLAWVGFASVLNFTIWRLSA